MNKKAPVFLHDYSVMAVPIRGALGAAALPTLLFFLCQSATAWADDYFDPAALEFANPQQKMADLHYFAKSGGQQPGTYPVTIWVNNSAGCRGADRIRRRSWGPAAGVDLCEAGGIWGQR